MKSTDVDKRLSSLYRINVLYEIPTGNFWNFLFRHSFAFIHREKFSRWIRSGVSCKVYITLKYLLEIAKAFEVSHRTNVYAIYARCFHFTKIAECRARSRVFSKGLCSFYSSHFRVPFCHCCNLCMLKGDNKLNLLQIVPRTATSWYSNVLFWEFRRISVVIQISSIEFFSSF